MGVAQLVEHWVVAPVVAGSNPVTHPITAITKEGVLDSLFYSVPHLFPIYKDKISEKKDLSKASFVEICEPQRITA